MKIRLHSLSALSLPFASTILLANLIFATGAFGQITQVTGSPQTTSTTSTTLTITKPSGLAVGDLMIANILQSDDDGGGINLSNASASGWTVLAGNSIGAGSSNEWWGTLLFKIANASDVAASSFSFTLDSDANDGNVGGLVAFSGVDTGLPFDAVGVFNTGDSDDLTAPSITTSVANAAVVMFGMVGDNRTMQNTGWNTGTPGSLTLTELFDETSSSGPDEAVSAAWTIKASAGATGDGDGEIDLNEDDFWGAILVSLRPAGISLTSPLTLAYGGTLTVPPNVNCIRVQVWGGGGGGGNESLNGSDGGGGGGGGGYAEGILLVTPGDNLTITVGGGGAGAVNTSGANGMAGGNSVVTHSSGTLTATGGGAGLGVVGSGGVGSGGSGSFSGSVYGQVSFSGGDGGAGDNNEGGGGGGGAGATGNGGDGSNPGGGSGGSGSGGDGGDGGDDGAGSNGAFIGGGGGSAGDDAGGGGNGAAGRVIVSWGLSSSTPGTITAGTPASSCTSPFNPPNISGDNPSGSETWSWQSSTDGGATWTTISGATSASYNPGNITTTTQFRRLRSVAGECPGISNVVVYTVATPTAAPGNVSLCIGQTVMMNGNPSGGTTPYNSHAWVVINGGSTGLGTGDLTNNNDGTVTINGAGATGAGNAILRYTVTDANGCTAQVTGTATVNAAPTAVISGALSFCAGGSTTLTASGGSSYEWDDNSANAMRTISAAGTYTVTVTAGNGCTDTETATVTENPLPTAVISGTLSFCAGGSTTLTASGGTTYLWDDNSTNAMRTISAAGTYTVQVTDGNGCTDTETATVTEVSVPACNITSGPTSVCPNSTGHMYTATGGGTYLWNVSGNGAIDGGNTGSAVTVDAGAAGTYTITVTVTAGGCTSSCSQTVNVEDNTLPTITCPANITVYTPSNSCEATGVALGSPVVSDNCSTTVSNDASEPYALGNTIVTWMVSDGTNSAVCLQTVKVNPYVAPPGEYFDLGTCQSTPCPPGTYCPGGTTAGIPCPAGTSQGLSGQQSCVDCPAGSYSSSIGAIECTACAAGTYNDMSGATSCTACPYGTSSMAGATSCTPLDPQHITVFGNSIQIANRANTTSGADHTDFGAVNVGNMVTRTFTIYNIVNAVPLKLSGNPSVEIADKNASDFSVTLQPSTPIAGGGSTTFTVKFQPTATGLRTAIVMIASDDYPENPFVFTIEGTGL